MILIERKLKVWIAVFLENKLLDCAASTHNFRYLDEWKCY